MFDEEQQLYLVLLTDEAKFFYECIVKKRTCAESTRFLTPWTPCRAWEAPTIPFTKRQSLLLNYGRIVRCASTILRTNVAIRREGSQGNNSTKLSPDFELAVRAR